MLAGVSVDYYTRLERGNLKGVSETVRPFAPVTVLTTTRSTHPAGCGVRAKEARPRSRTTPRPATAMASAPTISVVEAT
jgi:hypothetical protein